MAAIHSADIGSVREAWADWLSRQQWDLFPTVTPEKQTHPEAMLKRWVYMTKVINKHLYGNHCERRQLGVEWVVGVERFKSGWPHLHALVRFPLLSIKGQEGKAIFDLAYWQKWMSRTGGHVQLDQPRSQIAVIQYVSKYVTKEGDLYWSDNCQFTAAIGLQTTIDG